jgi:hypothetical protein
MMLIDALKNRIAYAVAERLNPRVAGRLRALEAEVQRLTVDNARLQQEVNMQGTLLRRTVYAAGKGPS